jgi:Phage integrase, N-terminal SAM-like domain
MDATRTTPLRERMRQELQLAGLSERTQEAYLRAVRQLATHFGKAARPGHRARAAPVPPLPQEREALRLRVPQDRLLRHPLLLPHHRPARLAHRWGSRDDPFLTRYAPTDPRVPSTHCRALAQGEPVPSASPAGGAR